MTVFERDPSPRASPDPASAPLYSPVAFDSSEEGPPLALLYPMDAVEDAGHFHEDACDMKPNQLGLSLPRRHLCRPSVAVQTSPRRSGSPAPVFPQAPTLRCGCITKSSVYIALVYFATALRTSREALETLHSDEGGEDTRINRHHCEFYRKVVKLDEHILCVFFHVVAAHATTSADYTYSSVLPPAH
jgi:hypothetical protein